MADDPHQNHLIDTIVEQGLKEGLFSEEEALLVRRQLSQLSSEELMREYLPRWYGDLYKWQPVDVKTWLYSPDFMNLEGQVWPVLADDLIELLEGNYREAILTGGIGWGKSFATSLVICRMLYELSCYKNPQLALGLASNSQIVIPNIATNAKVAKEVVFEYVAGFVRRSPYFRRHFPPDKDLTRELVFPNKIRVLPAASTQGSVIGQNIFAAVMDEANFLFKGESDRAMSVDEEYDLAKVLHNALQRRIDSRFGKNAGLLMIVSSSQYPDDFTEFRRKQAEESGERIFYRRYAQWTPKPAYQGFDRDEKNYFWLSIGDSANRPRVIREPHEKAYDAELDDLEALRGEGVELVKVPEDFRIPFERDLDMAIRDIAGFATLAKHPFFRNVQPIIESFARGKKLGLKHPWSLERTTLEDGSTWVKDRLDWKRRQYHHFAHVDLALTQDAAGISVVRLDGVEEHVFDRPYYDEINGQLRYEKDITYVPRLTTVMTLQVKPPPNGEIPLAKIRQILMDLVSWGFLLTRVTMDTYQSAQLLQDLNAAGVEADTLSVDRSMDAYNSLKEAFNEERLDTYEYPALLKECSELERDLKKKKVDHPPKGCFTGDTRIALLDGTLPTFEELAERYPNGEKFPVYSMTPKGVQVGWGRNPRITRRDAELVEVVLDNYQVIRCTPDHLFMTTGHDWVQAQHLTPDISIMPLYRTRANAGGWNGYERVWCPVRQERLQTHQLVAEQFHGPRGRKVVHHKDEVKHNNHPDNLELMDRRGHNVHHTTKRHAEDRDYVAKLREGHRAYRENGGNEKSRENMLRLQAEGKIKVGREPCAVDGCDRLSNAKGLCDMHYQRMRREQKKAQRTSKQTNHRILYVRPIQQRADVWDITVDEHHNFALASGVFVHNSKDVSDSLAGAVHSAALWVRENPSVMVRGDFEEDDARSASPVVFGDFDDEEDFSWIYS